MLRQLHQHLFTRRVPYGLFSWRFLLPGQPEKVRIHRQLALQQHPRVPRPLWLLVLLFAGLRWMWVYSPYYSFRILRHHGRQIETETGLTFWQQGHKLLSISMGHGILPSHWYQYRLYLVERQASYWDYIYDHEASAYHAWRNQGRANREKHQALLADKWQLEQLLSAMGIPMAQTLHISGRGDSLFIDILKRLSQQHGRLFCKKRTGNQAKGAFLADWKTGQLVIQPFGEAILAFPECLTFLQQRIAESDYLIQPEYRNHPSLTGGANSLPAATLRIISYCGQGNAVTLNCAYLEWPMIGEQGSIQHYPVPILCTTGHVQAGHWLMRHFHLSPRQKQGLGTLLQHLAGNPLPYWEDAASVAVRAHQQLAGLYGIAWDFILTDQGPVLLEGNSGWRVSVPQLVNNAGFLSEARI